MGTAVLKVLAYAIGLVVFPAYIYAMFIDPFLVGGWHRLHKVWFDWQTFNSAMIALFAAFIGICIPVYLSKSQNRAQFIVARAQLPEALALVGDYLEQYLLVLQEALKKIGTPAGNKQVLDAVQPKLDIEYKATFATCIAYGSAELRSALTDISKHLQIHKSRLSSLIEQEFQPDSKFALTEICLISNLSYVCETRSKINKLYPFARFETEQISVVVEHADIINVASKMDGNTLNKLNNYLKDR
jgi:hypothetical protein